MSGYTSVSITNEARDVLRRLTAGITGQLGQRVSMSDALRVTEHIINQHTAEIRTSAASLGIIDSPEGVQ